MLSDGNDPLIDREKLRCSSLFLVCTIIRHDAAAAIKGFLGEADFRFPFHEIIIGIFIRNHINGILQNRLDRKAGEVLSLLGFDSLPQQFCFHRSQRIGFHVEIKDHLGDFNLFGYGNQLVGLSLFAVNGDLTDGTGFEAGGCIATQPAASLCQFVHIIPDTLSDSFTLQL